MAICVEADDGDPLMRRPAIRRIPLLTRAHRSGEQTAGREQRCGNRSGDAVRLIRLGEPGEQRIQHRRTRSIESLAALPVIVEKAPARAIPQISSRRVLAIRPTLLELARTRAIA